MGTEPYRKPPNLIQKILLRYTYSQKINLIILLVCFYIAIITYLFIDSQLIKIKFTEKELIGNDYQKNIQQFYTNLVKNQIYVNYNEPGSHPSDAAKEINDDFRRFILLNHDLQGLLRTTDEDFEIENSKNLSPNKLYESWLNLQNSPNQKSIVEYAALINGLQSLLLYVGDSSNMTYDPEKETSYLMETSIRSLPKEQELIAQILIIGENINTTTGLSEVDRASLTRLSSLLSESVNTTERATYKSVAGSRHLNQNTSLDAALLEPTKRYKEASTNFISYLINEVIDTPTSDKTVSKETYKKISQLGDAVLQKNDHLWETTINVIKQLLEDRISSIRTTSYTLIGILVFCLGFAAFLGYFVMSETNSFFRSVYKAVSNFSKGDLTSRAPVAYDKSFETMRGVLNHLGDTIEDLIDQLHKSGVQLTSTTTQIAAAAKHQEGTVCQQSATIKQILITAGEISTTAKDFAKTMDQVSKSAEQTSQLAASGKEGLTQMETIMHQMVNASKNIASKLAVLNEKANAITSVITTITKVADQTNLLSLNASIEAEKAGEHGKSFAVIAREIRRLADQTANATLDIEKMISEMMSAVSEGVIGVDKFIEEIRSGVSQASTVSGQLSQIIERVQHQTESYEKVNKGAQLQSLGAGQINDSIKQLSDAAQETTKSIRQFHTAIEQLNIATKGMQVSVSRLKR